MREKLLDLMKNEGLKPSQARRTAGNQSRRNLPYSRRTKQTGLRSAAKDSPEVSPDQPGLAAARLG